MFWKEQVGGNTANHCRVKSTEMKSVGGAGREKGGAEGEVQVRSCCHPGVEPTAPTSWDTQSPWLPCCVWGTLQSPRSPAFPENIAGSAGADHQSRWSPAICCPGCQTAHTPRGRKGSQFPCCLLFTRDLSLRTWECGKGATGSSGGWAQCLQWLVTLHELPWMCSRGATSASAKLLSDALTCAPNGRHRYLSPLTSLDVMNIVMVIITMTHDACGMGPGWGVVSQVCTHLQMP